MAESKNSKKAFKPISKEAVLSIFKSNVKYSERLTSLFAEASDIFSIVKIEPENLQESSKRNSNDIFVTGDIRTGGQQQQRSGNSGESGLGIQKNYSNQGRKKFVTKSPFSGSGHAKDNNAKVWSYLDEEKNVQGPFSSNEMDQWYDAGYLVDNLQIKLPEETEFTKLRDRFGKVDQTQNYPSQRQFSKQDQGTGPSQGFSNRQNTGSAWGRGNRAPEGGASQGGFQRSEGGITRGGEGLQFRRNPSDRKEEPQPQVQAQPDANKGQFTRNISEGKTVSEEKANVPEVKPVEKPVEKAVEKPKEKPVEKSAEKTVEKPKEEPVEKAKEEAKPEVKKSSKKKAEAEPANKEAPAAVQEKKEKKKSPEKAVVEPVKEEKKVEEVKEPVVEKEEPVPEEPALTEDVNKKSDKVNIEDFGSELWKVSITKKNKKKKKGVVDDDDDKSPFYGEVKQEVKPVVKKVEPKPAEVADPNDPFPVLKPTEPVVKPGDKKAQQDAAGDKKKKPMAGWGEDAAVAQRRIKAEEPKPTLQEELANESAFPSLGGLAEEPRPVVTATKKQPAKPKVPETGGSDFPSLGGGGSDYPSLAQTQAKKNPPKAQDAGKKGKK